MVAKCPCDHCGENIEFATEEFLSGSNIVCPHCGKETYLSVTPKSKSTTTPLPQPKRETAKLPPPLPPTNAKKSSGFQLIEVGGVLFTIITCGLFIIGCGLVLSGCGNEIDEENKLEGSAIRQTVFAIQYCTGFILIALSLIIATLLRLTKK
jgi:hypothetical protein